MYTHSFVTRTKFIISSKFKFLLKLRTFESYKSCFFKNLTFVLDRNPEADFTPLSLKKMQKTRQKIIPTRKYPEKGFRNVWTIYLNKFAKVIIKKSKYYAVLSTNTLKLCI